MKTNYLKPAIKIVAVNVERGYAVSGVNTSAEVKGFNVNSGTNSIWGGSENK